MSRFNLQIALSRNDRTCFNKEGDLVVINKIDLQDDKPIKATVTSNGLITVYSEFHLDGRAGHSYEECEDLVNWDRELNHKFQERRKEAGYLSFKASAHSSLDHLIDLVTDIKAGLYDYPVSDEHETLILHATNIIQRVAGDREEDIEDALAHAETDEYHRATLR